MFIALSDGEIVNERFVVSIAADETPSEDGRVMWCRVTYLRGSIPRFAFCLSTDVEEFLAAAHAAHTDD